MLVPSPVPAYLVPLQLLSMGPCLAILYGFVQPCSIGCPVLVHYHLLFPLLYLVLLTPVLCSLCSGTCPIWLIWRPALVSILVVPLCYLQSCPHLFGSLHFVPDVVFCGALFCMLSCHVWSHLILSSLGWY